MANLQKIKDIAETKGISIRELAARVGLGENRIHVMCKTNSTKIETLENIARVLGVPVSCFFDNTITVEEYHAHGDRGFVARQINTVDQRATAAPDDCAPDAVLAERVKALEALLEEKERLIQILLKDK